MKYLKGLFALSLLGLLVPLSIGNSLSNTGNMVISPKITRNHAITFSNDDVDEHLGTMVGDTFQVGDYFYQNYTYGYAIGSDKVAKTYYAGHHMGADGVRVALDSDGQTYLTNLVASSFVSSGNEKVASTVDKTKLATEMRNVYSSYLQKGFCLGLAWENVKTWDGICIDQDFCYGDGTYSFDSGRVQMSFLMYSPVKEEAHAVFSPYIDAWNNNKTLGYPLSESENISVTLPNEKTAANIDIQIFEKGFIYLKSGVATVKTGYSFNFSDNTFTPIASPTVPEEFGELKNTLEFGTKKIFVYEYGSIISSLENNVYEYTLRPCRRYTSETEYTMVSALLMIQNEKVGTDFDNACQYTDEEKALVGPLLQEKYKSLYNAYKTAPGTEYVVGFEESSFSFKWNGINAQQFKFGDSSASPWEDARTNITALVWNEKAGTIVVLKDDPLCIWDDNWSDLGAPVEDSFEKDGNLYQQFENALLVMVNKEKDLSFFYKGSYEEYIKGVNSYEKPNITDDGKTFTYTYTDYTALYVGIGVGAGVLAIGAGLVVTLLLKKKRSKKAE